MHQLGNIELGCSPDDIRRIEQNVGTATLKEIEQVREQYKDATLLDVLLLKAQSQAQNRLDADT